MSIERKHYHYLSALLFNTVLFAVLYHWFSAHVSLRYLEADLRHLTYLSFVLVCVLYLINIMIAAWRFAALLGCDYSAALNITCVMYGLNNLLPFRAGDILSPLFAKRVYNFNLPETLMATFLSRYLDLVILMVLGGVLVLSRSTENDDYIVYALTVLLILSLITIALYHSLILRPGKMREYCLNVPFLASLLQSIERIMAQPQKWRLILVSGMLWLSVLFVYYFFFHINLPAQHFGLSAAILLLFTTTLCFAIPYSIAGIGIFETAIVYCLAKFAGVEGTHALTLAISFHLICTLPQVLPMFFVLARFRHKLLKSS